MSLSRLQQQFAAHIRNPADESGPGGIEDRRLKIYRDLFFNNIENFVGNSFPVLKSLYDPDNWQMMVRDFMVRHRCHSPYFLEISQEFLLYLQNIRELQPGDPPFLLELAHYEWVELGLDVAETDINAVDCDHDGDLLEGRPVVSPLAWSLAYRYPVHLVGPDYRPQQPGEQPTYLIVYRNRNDMVGFMEANAVTARLIELLQGAGIHSGRQALEQIAGEINHPQPGQLLSFGLDLLQQLRAKDIILGAASPY